MNVLLVLFFVALMFSGALLLRRELLRARVRGQLLGDSRGDGAVAPAGEAEPELHWLRAWLVHAGYRRPQALWNFALIAAVCLGMGVLVALALPRTGLVEQSIRGVIAIPGGMGLAFVPLLQAMPVTCGLMLASLPWFFVRSRRRRLVAQIEADLPIFLDLLSTLVESGHSFDAALAQLLDSEPVPRQLAQEMRLFQLEVRSGRPRLQCFQRLRDRVDVGPLTTLVSSLITAEQMGASIAEVLRAQADDIRNRRREQALAHAQTAPVKLVFPLIICFLPGLFVTTLGPAMYQLFQVIDNAFGRR